PARSTTTATAGSTPATWRRCARTSAARWPRRRRRLRYPRGPAFHGTVPRLAPHGIRPSSLIRNELPQADNRRRTVAAPAPGGGGGLVGRGPRRLHRPVVGPADSLPLGDTLRIGGRRAAMGAVSPAAAGAAATGPAGGRHRA